MARLSGGVRTSSMEMVRPDWAAYRNPRALIRSRLAATTCFGSVAATSSTIPAMGVLRFPTTSFTYRKPFGRAPLKNTRPGVVSRTSCSSVSGSWPKCLATAVCSVEPGRGRSLILA